MSRTQPKPRSTLIVVGLLLLLIVGLAVLFRALSERFAAAVTAATELTLTGTLVAASIFLARRQVLAQEMAARTATREAAARDAWQLLLGDTSLGPAGTLVPIRPEQLADWQKDSVRQGLAAAHELANRFVELLPMLAPELRGHATRSARALWRAHASAYAMILASYKATTSDGSLDALAIAYRGEDGADPWERFSTGQTFETAAKAIDNFANAVQEHLQH